MTFNAGLYESIGSVSVGSGYLAPGDIPSRVARRTETIKQLRQLKSHVICLQEVNGDRILGKSLDEPRRDKTCLRNFRPGQT